MPTFAVPGASLDAEFSNEGGQPVVQLHGLTSSRRRDRVLNLDLGRGLSGTRLLRYDARGHGCSSGRAVPEDYTWPNLATDLLQLLATWFPGERVHGVGPSMGAGTLLHAAVLNPDRFAGLTLMLPPTAWETRATKAVEYRAEASLIERDGVAGFAESGRLAARPPAAPPAPPTDPDVAEEILPSLLRGAAASDLPTPQQLAAVDLPVTVLAWIDDPAHPVSTATRLVGLLPRATLQIADRPAAVEQWPQVLSQDVARGDARVPNPAHPESARG